MLNAVNTQLLVLTSKLREEQRAYDNFTSQGYDVLPKIAKVAKIKYLKQ
jgi:transcriptional antiterminator RfaH